LALKKLEKLKNRSVFRNLHKLNVLGRNEYFKLLASKAQRQAKFNDDRAQWPKVAFIISRKKLRSAVKRNRAKRRIEEAYRLIKPSLRLHLEIYNHLVFLIEAAVLDVEFELLKALIQKAITNLRHAKNNTESFVSRQVNFPTLQSHQ